MLHAVLSSCYRGRGDGNPLAPRAGYDILWSAVCFVIILVFFWRYVLPRVQKLLDERAEAIEGNIAKADEAQRKAEAALEEYTAQLADARAEAGRSARPLARTARRSSPRRRTRPRPRPLASPRRAQAQIEAERQSALVSLRSEVGTLAIDLASGVIGESLSDDEQGAAPSSTASSPTSRPPRGRRRREEVVHG